MAQAQDPSLDPAQKPNAAVETPDEIVIDDDEIVVEEAPTGVAATATATLTDEKAESTPGAERVIYVATPVPPKPRSNRIIGSLLALLGSAVFALVYALVAALMQNFILSEQFRATGFGAFIRDVFFWAPVLFFVLGFVLVVLLLNRAAWWLHVLGSLLVAIIVYFGSIGLILLVTGIGGQSPTFAGVATSPYLIAATLVAREVSIWIGFLIALRGGRVKKLNKADREAFDSEQSSKSANSATKPKATHGAPASA
jgi:hypothetical protein